MSGLPERVLRDTTNGIPEAIALGLDWVLYGTMPEQKINDLFNHVESVLVDTTGPSMASTVSMAFQAALKVSGVKSKILNMGNGDSVHELARIACQTSDDDAGRAIQQVIAEHEPKTEPLQAVLQGVLRASVKLLPGISETSFLVGMLNNVAAALGYMDVKEKVELLAIVLIRYPDRLYRFLRRAFTLAVLHGHDVSQRAVQAEVLATVVPELVEYFQSLTVSPPHVAPDEDDSTAERIPSLVLPPVAESSVTERAAAVNKDYDASSKPSPKDRKASATDALSAAGVESDGASSHTDGLASTASSSGQQDITSDKQNLTHDQHTNHISSGMATSTGKAHSAATSTPAGTDSVSSATETSSRASTAETPSAHPTDPTNADATPAEADEPKASDDVVPTPAQEAPPAAAVATPGRFASWGGMFSRSGSATVPSEDPAPAGTESGTISFFSSIANRAQQFAAQAASAPSSALQVAGMAASALGGGYFSAIAQTASLGYNVYDGHRQSEREVQAWHHARVRMLRDASEKLRIETDFFVDQWQELMALGFTAVVLPAVAGVWNDIERIGSILYRTMDADGILLQTLGLEHEDITAMLVAMMCVLYSSLFLMLYKNAAFLRFTTPSLILSVLFFLRAANTWFLAYSASTNAVKILILLLKSKMWTMIDLGPPLVFMISALSTLLEKSTLVLVGRFLPFLIIVTYAARLSDVSFHIVAIAIGKLGQILLSFMLREKRGVMRRIVMWCFDDLLQAMAPVADTTISPDEKLHLISPSSLVSSLVALLTEPRAIVLGVAVGIFKGTTLPWWCWALVALVEACVVVVWAALDQTRVEDCWDRWNALLPEHAPRIAHMERFWRAYLQTKPTFTLTSSPDGPDAGYHLCLRLYEPWVRGASKYVVRYRQSVGLLRKTPEWEELYPPDLSSRAAFDRHIAAPEARIYLSGLAMASLYEVRVDAVRNVGSGLIVGNVLRSRTDFPTLVVSSLSATAIKIKALDPSVLNSATVKLRYRRGMWPWNYRNSLNILTAPKLLLKDDGTCLLQELTPGCSYEVQFQITTGDDITDWLPVTPPSVTLPEPRRLGRVTHNFTAKHDNELSARAGDVVVLLSDVDENWINVKLGAQTGIFPKNRYIEETFEASTPDGTVVERSDATAGMLRNMAARAMSGNMDIATPARQSRDPMRALD